MPNYRLHMKMASEVYKPMQKYIEIDKDLMALNAVGPDAYNIRDSKVFNEAHAKHVGNYFKTLMDEIKSNKLYDNSSSMAYLYGTICHYALDLTTHPLINYMTTVNDINSNIWELHGLFEFWLDDYFDGITNDNSKVFNKIFIKDKATKLLIDDVMKRVYQTRIAFDKYQYGLISFKFIDEEIRQNKLGISPLFDKLVVHGNFYNNGDMYRAVPYLNLEHDKWFDPITLTCHYESFMDLYYKALITALELIEMANNYIYHDKLINFDLFNKSYDTGHDCNLDNQVQIYRLKKIDSRL